MTFQFDAVVLFAVGIANIVFGVRQTHFDGIAKSPRIEPEYKDFRKMYRSDGVRERAEFRVCGYRQLALGCAIGLIIYAAAMVLYPYYKFWADLAIVGVVTMAVVTFNALWCFGDRLSRAIENFNVYHYGRGRSIDSFEEALEKFALMTSHRMRSRHVVCERITKRRPPSKTELRRHTSRASNGYLREHDPRTAPCPTDSRCIY